MTDAVLSLLRIERGKTVPADITGILSEAEQAVAKEGDVKIRGFMRDSIDQLSCGEIDAWLLLYDENPAGVMTFDLLEDDAQIYFGYLGESFRGREGTFFEAVVEALRQAGASVIRTNFLWPRPERYVEAARDLGFILRERLSMLRENDAGYMVKPPAEGVEFLPWSELWITPASRLLFEEANPVDREIYPGLRTMAGTVSDLAKVTGNCYGMFLPESSTVAVQAGRLIGLLLATEFGAGEILIAELAVAEGHRGRGIGSGLLGRAIRDSAAMGPGRVEVVVNAQNAGAIRLYEHAGFRLSVRLQQYILVLT